jgi:RNA polymerase sigma-70 factor (sigma-E family)
MTDVSPTGWAALTRAAWWAPFVRPWMRSRENGDAAGRHRALHAVATSTRHAPITELYHTHRLRLVRLAILMVDDLPTAEDVVQDAFTALYRRHGAQLQSLDDPHAYLTSAVMNTARSTLRRRRSARGYVPPRPENAASADELALLNDDNRQVIEALRQLTVRQRQVLVLRYWSQLSEVEIAEALAVSRGTVKSTASNALSALRRLLQER